MAATTIEKLAIELGLETKELKSSLKQMVSDVKKNTTQVKKDFKSVSSEINKMHQGIKKMATSLAAKVGFVGFAASIGKSVQMSMKQEEIFKKLQTAIELTGKKWEESKPEVDAFLASMQKTTRYSDTDMAPALQQITLLTGSLEKGFVGAKIAADIASTGLFDLNTASRYVAMAMSGEVTMLGRYIPELKETALQQAGVTTQSQKIAYAMDILNKKFGGAAAKDINTFTALLSQLRNYIGDIVEKFGDLITVQLAPTIRSWRDSIIEFIESGGLAKWAENVGEKIKNLYGIVKNVFVFLSKNWDIISSIAVGIAAVVAGIEAWTLVQTILNAVMTANPIGLIIVGIGALIAIINYAVKKTVGWAAVWEVVQKAMKTYWEYCKLFGGLMKDWIITQVRGFGSLGKVLEGVFTLNLDKIKEGMNDLKELPADIYNSFKDRFTAAGENAIDIWKKTKEEIEAEEIEPEITPTITAPGGTTPSPAPAEEIDPAILKRISDLRIENIQDEYDRRRAIADAWRADEIEKAKGNAALLAEIEKQYGIKIEEIEKDKADKKAEIDKKIRDLSITNIQDEYERKREEARAWAEDEIKMAEGNAELIAQIRKQLGIRLNQIDKDMNEETVRIQKEAIDEITAHLYNSMSGFEALMTEMFTREEDTRIGEEKRRARARAEEQIFDAEGNAERIAQIKRDLAKELDEIDNSRVATFQNAMDTMAKYFLTQFVQSVIKGIAQTVAATVVGETTKQKAMLETAATAIATGAKEVGSFLASAAAAIYNALANIAKKLAFLGPLAIPAIAAAGAGLIALMGKFKKTLGLARGTRVKEPTAALIGEDGPEIVAPEKDFITYSRELIRSFMEKVGMLMDEVERPIIEAAETQSIIKEVRMMGAASSPSVIAAAGGREVSEEELILLKQIRDNLDNLDLSHESILKGEDIYQVVELKTREHGRKEY